MRPLSTIKFKIPSNIEANIVAKLQYDPPSWVKKSKVDKFLYVVSKIITLSSTNRKYSKLKLVPISSVVLRYELGKHYKKYLDWMIKHKFIETDNHYIVGSDEREGKCKCFGLTKPYKSKKLIEFELKDEFILRKIINWKESKLSESISDPMMGRLYEMMDKFHIDIDGVESELRGLCESGYISEKQMQIELDKCYKINDKNDNSLDMFIVKDSYSRIHTNLTNISKRVRENHLYIDGKKTVGVDIVSSQPALLHSLIQDYIDRIKKIPEIQRNSAFFIEMDSHRTDIREKYKNKRNNFNGDSVYNDKSEFNLSKLGFSCFSDTQKALERELSFYAHSLDCGIYEFYQEEWGKFWDEDISRDKMKQYWLTYVFGQGKSDSMIRMGYIWDYHYPVLNKLLKYFKVGDYKVLSHKLQRKEAELIYDKLCPEIDNKLGIDYSTVHDSILVDESNAEAVRNIFTNILDENNVLTVVS